MKELLIAMFLIATSSAWAEWVKASETDDANWYLDPASIRKDGNLRRVWQIQDLKQRNKDGEMSRRARYEYDCKQERYRFLSFSTHSEPMAGGTTLVSGGENAKWHDIPPDSFVEIILKFLCAK